MRKIEIRSYRKKSIILKSKATLKDFILHEMAKRNMSGTAFANFVGVSAGTVNAYIRGDEIEPSLAFLRKLAKATNVSMATVINFAFPEVAAETRFDSDVWLIARQLSDLPEDIRNLIKSLVSGNKTKGSRDKS